MLNKQKRRAIKAFTLVELIVVIVILAILATIAFLSFTSQSGNARDSARLSDMSNIMKGLKVFQTNSGKLPLPDQTRINIFSGPILIGYQGYAGSTVLGIAKLSANGGKDPADGSYYIYSTNLLQNKGQLVGFLENQSTATVSYEPFKDILKADAAVIQNRYPVEKGDPLGVILSVSGSAYTPIQDIGAYQTSSGIDVSSGSIQSNSGIVAITDNSIAPANVISQLEKYYISSNQNSITLQWNVLDSNCKKPDIFINGLTWAGCNSTLGNMNIVGTNIYNASCYDYAGNALATTACQSPLATESWSGITSSGIYAPTQGDNIYGKNYQFDTDIKGNCSVKTIAGQTVYGSGANCPCPAGWHIPSDQEIINLTTYLNGGVICETTTGWLCSGLGWMNQNTRTSSNNLVKALGLPLEGSCTSGVCQNRGVGGNIWTSTETGSFAYRRGYSYSVDTLIHGSVTQSGAYSVRCVKDY